MHSLNDPPREDGYLMRFRDGAMSLRRNIGTMAGTSGNVIVPPELFGWPLPDRIGILCHTEAENVALWDADDPSASGLPSEILGSPNAVIYVKLSESKLPKDLSMVVRGAEYGLERAPQGG